MTAFYGMSSQVAPPPTPADIGLVIALPIEIAPLQAKLQKTRRYSGRQFSVLEGELAGQVIALCIVGMGRNSAARGVRFLMDGHRPRWLVSAGFAGALDPSLMRNDIVMPSEVVGLDGSRFAIDVEVPAKGTLRTGRLLTVDGIVRRASERARLREEYSADLVDMETSAIAAECANRNQRFLSVRIVSDSADMDLPVEVTTIMGATGSYRIGAALGALWKRPGVIGELLTLREQALESAAILSEFLIAALPRLG